MNTLDYIKIGFAAIGASIGAFIGGWDGFILGLVLLMLIDYCTGIIDAIYQKKLSSKIGAIGILRKVLMFVVIGCAHILDTYVLHTPGVLRTATIFFYSANEGLSILENLGNVGVPIPHRLKNVLSQLKEKEDTKTLDKLQTKIDNKINERKDDNEKGN